MPVVPLKALRPPARSVIRAQYLNDISLQLIGDNEGSLESKRAETWAVYARSPQGPAAAIAHTDSTIDRSADPESSRNQATPSSPRIKDFVKLAAANSPKKALRCG
jgi:hypothetical protein